MKKLSKNLIALAIMAFLFLPVLSLPALAEADFGLDQDGLVLSNEVDPKTGAVNIINLALTFLGLIALVIILIGGFKWMTAGGNEDKVGEAKKLLGAGIIGLVIVLAAWGIATYVIGTVNNTILTPDAPPVE